MRQKKTLPSEPTRRSPPAKLTATALDAAAVAGSTTLIIGMVGSLVFFLIIAFYRGQYDSRLMYIFGLYTAATVLIARIAIESGRGYANAFSVPLAVVSILAIMRFVNISGPLAPLSWLINIGLLALTWILADRITFDCTLISERQRSLQQGLLQSLGLLKSDGSTNAGWADDVPKKRKHNPGVWVLYFALLAFPLFGLGQLAIPDDSQRRWAFTFLISYLASALSLLVLTSLVGMRRYLRQRGVAMPPEMSLQWLSFGIGSMLIILLLCLVLPLPGRSLGLIGLPAAFQSPDALGASRWGWGQEGSSKQANAEAARVQPADAAGEREADQAPTDGPPRADGKGPPQASQQAGDDAPTQGSEQGKGGNSQDQSNRKSPAEPQSNQSTPPASAPKENDTSTADQGQSADDSSPNNSNSESSDQPQNRAPAPEPDGNRTSNDSSGEKPRGDQAPPPDEPETTQPPPAESSNDELDADSNTPSNSTPSATNPISQFLSQFSSLSELFKWLTMVVLAAIVIIYAVTHPAEIARLWRELCAMFAALFGRRGPTATVTTAIEGKSAQPAPRRPFSSFANPFTSHSAGWTPAQVIEHSFAALEAWAAEHGTPRQEQQTAAEFARQVTTVLPAVGQQAHTAAGMLDQLMFADWQPQAEDVKPLAQLWRSFSSVSPRDGSRRDLQQR